MPESEALCGALPAGERPAEPAPIDPDLAAVVAAWNTLPEAIRAGIAAMVKAAGKTANK